MNALVNPGAISATSMVTGANADAVWKKIIGTYNDFAGRPLTVLQDVYKSESDTNQRNQAIGALMFAYGYIKTDWRQAVDLYTRQCSVGVNAKDLAMMAATLAAGGKNPVTGKQVLDAAKVPGVLAVMATAGLYDDSGKWLYHTGLPARAASAAASSPCRPASSASPSSRRRSTMRATACARRRRLPTFRTRSAAIRTPRRRRRSRTAAHGTSRRRHRVDESASEAVMSKTVVPMTDKRGEEWSRLQAARTNGVAWRKWGPYLSERQWGTVREDYSVDGNAWEYFTHDQARSRAYHWGEDGLAGISDDQQQLCFALALWNGHDPILKERLFGLTNAEGNHGEDVKEYYFYLDSTPTHSYMKWLYKYPQRAYPVRRAGRDEPAAFAQRARVRAASIPASSPTTSTSTSQVEYAKASPEDILIRITATNRGAEAAPLHVLPTIWFRNTWRGVAG